MTSRATLAQRLSPVRAMRHLADAGSALETPAWSGEAAVIDRYNTVLEKIETETTGASILEHPVA